MQGSFGKQARQDGGRSFSLRRRYLNLSLLVIASGLFTILSSCEKSDRSYSLMADAETFQQTATYVPRKVDILWIIDNSGSMKTSQDNLTANFSRFISRFQSLKYDFHMGINTTDAWLGRYNSSKVALRRLKDGTSALHSGVFVMDKDTPDIDNVFVINASQGVTGSGDERAFSAIEDTLGYAENSDFRRTDAFLAVIVVSDEDDFSATSSTTIYNNYNSSKIIPVSTYKTFLDNYAGSGNWSFNAITILDETCRATLNAQSSGRLIGKRYMELADLSNGTKSSLCGDFGESMQLISDTLIQLSSTFTLNREPDPATIKVIVNGQTVATDATNGWTYDATTLTITFHGTAVPAAGDAVVINFDPVAPKN